MKIMDAYLTHNNYIEVLKDFKNLRKKITKKNTYYKKSNKFSKDINENTIKILQDYNN